MLWVKRLDLLLLAMKGKKLTEQESVCGACGQRGNCLTDDEKHSVCLDCYEPKAPWMGQQPTRVPQGDLLVRLPLSPQFTKRFQ
jgi:hypothetical protein